MSASDLFAIPRGPQLLALTGEAAAAAGRWIVRLERLPLRIGLERRIALPMWRTRFSRERRRYDPNIALFLETADGDAHVSGAHCVVEYTDDGLLVVRHLARFRGTWVGETYLTPFGTRCASLRDESVVVLGGRDSPYVFQYFDERAFDESEASDQPQQFGPPVFTSSLTPLIPTTE